jgi:hypothetical protein
MIIPHRRRSCHSTRFGRVGRRPAYFGDGFAFHFALASGARGFPYIVAISSCFFLENTRLKKRIKKCEHGNARMIVNHVK